MWRFTSGSVAGTAHLAVSAGCQDFSLVKVVAEDSAECVLVIAAADGAGSAQRGKEGASWACSVFIAHVELLLSRGASVTEISETQTIDGLFDDMLDVIDHNANADGVGRSEFACTFLGAVVGNVQSVFFQIGDGAIVVDDGDSYTCIFDADRGEYFNETRFLTNENAIIQLRVETSHRPISEVAVLTDGLELLAIRLDTGRPHAPFFDSLFRVLRTEPSGRSLSLDEQMGAWFRSPIVGSRTNDDLTLVLATRKSPG